MRRFAALGQSASLPVVAIFGTAPPSSESNIPSILQGLAEQGYVADRNFALAIRTADGHMERLPALAAELVQQRVAVIVSLSGSPAALAMKSATATIPVVFLTGDDPVAAGLVAAFNRPGGNLTGVSMMSATLAMKQVEVAHEAVPGAEIIAMLVNPNGVGRNYAQSAEEAGRAIGREIVIVTAGSENEFEAAFKAAVDQHAGALVVPIEPLFGTRHQRLATLAARFALPTVFSDGDLAASGALMTYGVVLPDLFRQIGAYAGKILAGTKPADLPVLLPEKVLLRVNLKTAKALGLALPQSILVRADEVIE